MTTPLLTARSVEAAPADFVRRCGEIRATFDHRTQDSGNVSWLVDTDDGPLFVKTAGLQGSEPVGASAPRLGFGARVGLLRNAAAIARSCSHPSMARLRNVVETPVGPLLVYDAAAGELVGGSAEGRVDPSSAYRRFAGLDAARQLAVFDQLIDLHRALAEGGWVAEDLYDGCLIVDFETDTLTVIDLDSYRRAAGTNTMGRMFGSRRFMAPEEFELGAPIDERTTVFTLGRLVWHFGTRLTERAEDFCGGDEARAVARTACAVARGDRHPTVAVLAARWRDARGGAAPLNPR